MRRSLPLALVALAALLTAAASGAAGGPSASAPPTVTGVLQQGKKLTALTGKWTGTGTITYAFQWYRCDVNASHCSSIHGATKPAYTMVAKDVGKTIALTVRASDPTGTGESYAAAAGLVAASASTLVASAQPVLAGDPLVGKPLSVQNAVWSTTPAATTYAWLRCNANGRICTAIAGQTAASYTLTADDAGHTLVAAATGTAGTAKQTVLTIRSAVVRATPGPLLQQGPAVTGTLQQGKKLTGTTGTWSSGGTVTYAYQWYRCDPSGAHCSSIHGSTKPTYTMVAKDVGQTIALTVRATDATGTAGAYASLAGLVAAPGAKLVATAQPKLDGTGAVGSVLTVEPATWSGTAGGATYGWLRCNANGRLCTKIAGAASSSYTLTAGDAGHVLVAAASAASGTSLQTVYSLGAVVTG
jgi:hypothetical protein